jgi:hypothetical protein
MAPTISGLFVPVIEAVTGTFPDSAMKSGKHCPCHQQEKSVPVTGICTDSPDLH